MERQEEKKEGGKREDGKKGIWKKGRKRGKISLFCFSV